MKGLSHYLDNSFVQIVLVICAFLIGALSSGYRMPLSLEQKTIEPTQVVLLTPTSEPSETPTKTPTPKASPTSIDLSPSVIVPSIATPSALPSGIE